MFRGLEDQPDISPEMPHGAWEGRIDDGLAQGHRELQAKMDIDASEEVPPRMKLQRPTGRGQTDACRVAVRQMHCNRAVNTVTYERGLNERDSTRSDLRIGYASREIVEGRACKLVQQPECKGDEDVDDIKLGHDA